MPDAKHVVANITSIVEEFKLMPRIGDEERMIGNKQALRLLLPAIMDLQRKGYSIEKIAEKLGDRGLVVSPATLRGYLRGKRKKQKAASGRARSVSAQGTSRTVRTASETGAVQAAVPAVPPNGAQQSESPRADALAAPAGAGGATTPRNAGSRNPDQMPRVEPGATASPFTLKDQEVI